MASTYVDRVGFEVDEIDESWREGWSVLATGRARLVTDNTELRSLQQLGVTPWAEWPRTQYIRIMVRTISGRRLSAAADRSEGTNPGR
jgi:nitroimidazol reductase NimA-like FMN-containing flavoprotein (pyridoxamine 5'-phosphate oxidase superfamily)